jgi:hypothetical protein
MDTLKHLVSWARRWWVVVLLGSSALGIAAPSDDPPGRVGRLADLQGSVYWFDHEQGQWSEAERNLPLTSGDRISTAAQGRAELRVGSSVLRLGSGTELELQLVDDERMVFHLHAGSLAVRLRTREMAEETELLTPEARLLPTRAGHYRLDRLDDRTQAGAWRGTLRVDESPLLVETGQRLELWRTGRRGERGELRHEWANLPDDSFAVWALSEDRRDERTAASRYVSPEMTGAEDLERHGRWEDHPEYGAFWVPFEVRAGWAPYRYGRWTWVRPWGWTWVDEAPWGFAPFHYGRWVHWRGRWGWLPGSYVARPVYAPALVAWVGGSGPGVAWVALGPLDFFLPWYRSTPVHRDHINTRPHRPGQQPQPIRPPTGPVMYGNQGTPGAVTVVPRDVLVHRGPVGSAVIDEPHDRSTRGPGRPGWQPTEPPQREARPPGNLPPPIMRTLPVPQRPSMAPIEVPHRDARVPDRQVPDRQLPDRHSRDRQPAQEVPQERTQPVRPAPPERHRERPLPPPVAAPAPAAAVQQPPAARVAPPVPAPAAAPVPVRPAPPAADPSPPRPRPREPEAQRAPEEGRKTQPEGRQSRERENLR